MYRTLEKAWGCLGENRWCDGAVPLPRFDACVDTFAQLGAVWRGDDRAVAERSWTELRAPLSDPDDRTGEDEAGDVVDGRALPTACDELNVIDVADEVQPDEGPVYPNGRRGRP